MSYEYLTCTKEILLRFELSCRTELLSCREELLSCRTKKFDLQ